MYLRGPGGYPPGGDFSKFCPLEVGFRGHLKRFRSLQSANGRGLGKFYKTCPFPTTTTTHPFPLFSSSTYQEFDF